MPRIIKTLCFAPALLLCALHADATFAQSDRKAEARTHFEKGLALFDARLLNEAAAEFDAAYHLSPAFVVLYNIGQVNVALGRPIEAVEAFTRYLEQGGQTISPERQRQVRTAIDAQSERIGTIAIFARPEGAEVRVDSQPLGETPLRHPARLAAGRHTVQVARTNYITEVRDVRVVGGQQVEVQIDLVLAVTPQPPAQSSPPPAERVARPERSTQDRGADSQAGERQKVAGYLLGGAGLVATSIGIVFGLTSASQASSAKQRLQDAATGTVWDDAKADYDSAKSLNRVGWIVSGCGVAAAIAGAVLVITASAPVSAERGPHVELTPWLLPAAAGLSARSSW